MAQWHSPLKLLIDFDRGYICRFFAVERSKKIIVPKRISKNKTNIYERCTYGIGALKLKFLYRYFLKILTNSMNTSHKTTPFWAYIIQSTFQCIFLKIFENTDTLTFLKKSQFFKEWFHPQWTLHFSQECDRSNLFLEL